MSCSPVTELFKVAVDKILESWTVLQLAVQHGFGGAESRNKAAWLSEALVQWFQENQNLEYYEVDDFLSDVLNSEFDTLAEDGSLTQVSRCLCSSYELCKQGNTTALKAKLDALRPANIGHCQPHKQEEQDEEEENEDMECADSAPQLVNTSQAANIQHIDPASVDYTNNTDNSAHQDESQSMEDDGWTMIGKKGKRR